MNNNNSSILTRDVIGIKIKQNQLLDLNNHHGIQKWLRREVRLINNLIFDSLSLKTTRLQIVLKFFRYLERINRIHGTVYTVKYLKACTVALQRFIAGKPVKSLAELEPNYPFPRLSKGLPIIMGPSDISRIRSYHDLSIIRFWLTWFGVYRVLRCPFKPKLSTITDPFSGDDVEDWRHLLRPFVRSLCLKGLPKLSVLKVVSFRSTWRSSPSTKFGWLSIIRDFFLISDSSLLPLVKEWIQLTHSMPFFTYWKMNFESNFLDSLKKRLSYDKRGAVLGKLAFKEEAAGKLRVFALVDSFTQTLLKPLHDYLFVLLADLPMDGTFDQDAAVKRGVNKMKARGCAYSYDLSSATDRLPISLQSAILSELFQSPRIGDLWKEILISRDYVIQRNLYGIPEGSLRYSVGQPMGALSSWAMLAITHHFIVQYCAWRVRNSISPDTLLPALSNKEISFSLYKDYELLGDDIVIFSKPVADYYHFFMTKVLGVDINLSKSLISESGTAFEFAKRTIHRNGEVSGIPLKGLLAKPSFERCSSMYSKLIDFNLLTPNRLVTLTHSSIANFSRFYSKRNQYCRDWVWRLLESNVYSRDLSLEYNIRLLRSYLSILVSPHFEAGKFPVMTGIAVLTLDPMIDQKLAETQKRFNTHLVLANLSEQLTSSLTHIYEKYHDSSFRWRSELAEIMGSVAMGIQHPLTPELNKFLDPYPYPEYLRDNFGSYLTRLGLMLSDPGVFEYKFLHMKINKMFHPLLDSLSSSVLLYPVKSFYTEKDERNLTFIIDFFSSVSPNNIGWSPRLKKIHKLLTDHFSPIYRYQGNKSTYWNMVSLIKETELLEQTIIRRDLITTYRTTMADKPVKPSFRLYKFTKNRVKWYYKWTQQNFKT